jgi:hypothetical protein
MPFYIHPQWRFSFERWAEHLTFRVLILASIRHSRFSYAENGLSQCLESRRELGTMTTRAVSLRNVCMNLNDSSGTLSLGLNRDKAGLPESRPTQHVQHEAASDALARVEASYCEKYMRVIAEFDVQFSCLVWRRPTAKASGWLPPPSQGRQND